jgi:hypothetical protein
MNHNPNPLVQPRKGGDVARLLSPQAEFQATKVAGKLIEILVVNNGAATNFQVHDSASTPNDGAEPLLNVPLKATDWTVIPWEESIRNGIYVCASDDPDQKTINTTSLQVLVRHEYIT